MNRNWGTILLILALPVMCLLCLVLVGWRHHVRHSQPEVAQNSQTDVDPALTEPAVAVEPEESLTPALPPKRLDREAKADQGARPDPDRVDPAGPRPSDPINPIKLPANPGQVANPQERPPAIQPAPPKPVGPGLPGMPFDPGFVGPPAPPAMMPLLPVPNVLGMTAATAQQVLAQSGMLYQAASPPLDPVRNTIYMQTPPVGYPSLPQTAVVVSFNVTVPDLVKPKMDPPTAVAALAKLNLSLSVTDSSRSMGPATSQTPAAGSQITPGGAVGVVFTSQGVTVPNVVGLSPAQAQALLTRARLGATLTDANGSPASTPAQRARLGSVTSQNPVAGLSVAAGGSVSMTASTVGVPNMVNGARYNRVSDIPQFPQLGLSVIVTPGSPTQAPANRRLVITGQNPPANTPLGLTTQAITVTTAIQ
jgi:beta-lactam-binding protein with PASTA domain